jgi:hypothetical protein
LRVLGSVLPYECRGDAGLRLPSLAPRSTCCGIPRRFAAHSVARIRWPTERGAYELPEVGCDGGCLGTCPCRYVTVTGMLEYAATLWCMQEVAMTSDPPVQETCARLPLRSVLSNSSLSLHAAFDGQEEVATLRLAQWLSIERSIETAGKRGTVGDASGCDPYSEVSKRVHVLRSAPMMQWLGRRLSSDGAAHAYDTPQCDSERVVNGVDHYTTRDLPVINGMAQRVRSAMFGARRPTPEQREPQSHSIEMRRHSSTYSDTPMAGDGVVGRIEEEALRSDVVSTERETPCQMDTERGRLALSHVDDRLQDTPRTSFRQEDGGAEPDRRRAAAVNNEEVCNLFGMCPKHALPAGTGWTDRAGALGPRSAHPDSRAPRVRRAEIRGGGAPTRSGGSVGADGTSPARGLLKRLTVNRNNDPGAVRWR